MRRSYARKAAFGSALLLVAEAIGGGTPAAAREATHAIDIPAGPLEGALARFSEQTGLSIGVAGAMPRIVTRRVAGRMGADAALRRLLKGSGLRARRVGATYRIERAPRRRHPPRSPVRRLPCLRRPTSS